MSRKTTRRGRRASNANSRQEKSFRRGDASIFSKEASDTPKRPVKINSVCRSTMPGDRHLYVVLSYSCTIDDIKLWNVYTKETATYQHNVPETLLVPIGELVADPNKPNAVKVGSICKSCIENDAESPYRVLSYSCTIDGIKLWNVQSIKSSLIQHNVPETFLVMIQE